MFEGLLLLLTVGLAIYYAPAMIKTWWHGGAWGLRGLLEYPAVMSRRLEQQRPDPAPVAPIAQPAIEEAKPIAIPQIVRNPRFAVAPEIATLSALLEKDPDVVEAAIQVLARLCDADEIGETAALKTGLGISPSSTSAKYKAAKAALQAARAPAPADDPTAWEAGDRSGQLVRKGSAI